MSAARSRWLPRRSGATAGDDDAGEHRQSSTRRGRPDARSGFCTGAPARDNAPRSATAVAGCLRTPAGGSSRQRWWSTRTACEKVRLLSAREAARLMGAPDTFELPSSYNHAYHAMGDPVWRSRWCAGWGRICSQNLSSASASRCKLDIRVEVCILRDHRIRLRRRLLGRQRGGLSRAPPRRLLIPLRCRATTCPRYCASWGALRS